MTQISARSLMIAIGCMVADRERLLLRIARATPAADEEERLSEMVVDIDKALGELGDEYEQQRTQAAAYPSYDDLVASAIESVKAES